MAPSGLRFECDHASPAVAHGAEVRPGACSQGATSMSERSPKTWRRQPWSPGARPGLSSPRAPGVGGVPRHGPVDCPSGARMAALRHGTPARNPTSRGVDLLCPRPGLALVLAEWTSTESRRGAAPWDGLDQCELGWSSRGLTAVFKPRASPTSASGPSRRLPSGELWLDFLTHEFPHHALRAGRGGRTPQGTDRWAPASGLPPASGRDPPSPRHRRLAAAARLSLRMRRRRRHPD